MKNQLILFLLFIFSTLTINAQNIVEGLIINAETQQPIPFANIGIIANENGTVSNDEGVFKLSYKDKSDLVTFSCIGYQSTEISVKEILQQNRIKLTPVAYDIETVKVEASRINTDEKRYGVKNKTRGRSIAYGSAQLGTEIGTPIRIKKKTFLKTANFVINHAKGDSMVFRVNIYEFKRGKIGETILKEAIIIREQQKKGVLTVDLIPYNLFVEDDVLLSLAWITDDNGRGNEGLTFDMKNGKKVKGIYIRKNGVSDFFRMKFVQNKNLCFYFIGNEVN